MTGFAQCAAEGPARRYEIVLQGWNHRHLDVVVRLPEGQRELEPRLRERIAARVARGRCELVVRVSDAGERRVVARIDAAAVRALVAAAEELGNAAPVDLRLTLGDLLRAPQLLAFETDSAADVEAEADRLVRTVDDALDSFLAARESEGRRLAAVIERARGELAAVVDRLEARRQTIEGGLEGSLRARLDELIVGGASALPAERLAQEIVLLVERADVREELDRLRAHLEHVAEVCAAPGAIGKRLDFLAQEVARELNTLGAKCRDAEMTRLVVDAKVICEQLREQVQNVE